MSDDKFVFDFEYKMRKQIQEDEENFVYTAILPFCETITEKKLSKKELEEILRKGMKYSNLLDKIKKAREQIIDEKDFAYANFEQYKEEVLCIEPDELPDDDYRYGMERCIEILDKYKAEMENEE